VTARQPASRSASSVSACLRRGCVVAAALFGAATTAEATIYHCGPDGKLLQDRPCIVVSSPPREPPKPPCDLDADQRKRAVRAEEQFLKRFPEELVHRRAQLADLQPVVDGIGRAKVRLDELTERRKSIDKERAFYVGKPLPPWLKAQLDESEAHFVALAQIFVGHEQSIADIRKRYECDRATYGKLWSGAGPGASACNRPTCALP
jgi:hypothetical protein